MHSRLDRIVTAFVLPIICLTGVSILSNPSGALSGDERIDSYGSALRKHTEEILKQSCVGCHRTDNPKAELDLSMGIENLIGAPSVEMPALKLIDLEDPERSYLLMKIRGDEGIFGQVMPINAPPLDSEEIYTISLWIYSLYLSERIPESSHGSEKKKESKSSAAKMDSDLPGTFLVNLPTTTGIGAGDLLFRISHRYLSPTRVGYDSYYGLDGPAYILLSVGYGLTDRIDVTIGRTNLRDEVELGLGWRPIEQGGGSVLPVTVRIVAGGILTTETPPDREVFASENLRLFTQLCISRRVTDRLILLIVPSFVSNTDYSRPEEEETVSIGLGGSLRVWRNVSLVGEWIPVLSGYETGYDTWGLGLEAVVGGHVFHMFVNNAPGLTPNQYLAGGDLQLGEGEMRIGFNIFRTFWF